MEMKDAMFLLKLKNYSETRKFAIKTRERIKMKDHLKWIERNIHFFNVINENDIDIGFVRIQSHEISIWIERRWWNLGYATKAIAMSSKNKTLYAKIVDGNIGSMRAFISADYKPIDHRKNYYIFAS